MKRFLVGVDDSSSGQMTLRWAADLAQRAGVELVAARVFVPTQAELPPDQFTDLHERQLGELDDWCAELPGATTAPVTTLLDGDPADALLDAAHEHDADLLVVGGRGAGGFAGLHLGSVTHHLVHHTDVPLAIVPHEHADTVTHLVVGVDGSTDSLTAVDFASELAPALGVDVTAVHAFEPFLEWVPENAADSWHHRAETELRDWIAPIERAGVAVDTDIDRDIHPVAALERALRNHPGAMAVIGARGAGGFTGLRLGRVPLQLVHHTSSPVLVVPRSGR